MTKRERVLACLARKTVDRAPVSFWRHAPDVDHTARGLADAMLAFHRRFDLDILKVMSSGVYCVDVPEDHLAAVVDAVKAHGGR